MYDYEESKIIFKNFKIEDCRTWPYYVIEMPILNDKGPVSHYECDEMTYEVWDLFFNSYGSYKILPDAINEAIRLTLQLKKQHMQ